LAGLAGRVTLVEAPLGYGKTTLIMSWVEALQSEGIPVAYQSLEGATGDQVQILRRHLASLRFREDEAENTCGKEKQTCLVLDDFHEADHACRFFVQSLLSASPSFLHLIVGSREPPGFPLTKLRMAEQVTDFTRDDLRFTREEARVLFEVDLPAEQLDAYLHRSEGWSPL